MANGETCQQGFDSDRLLANIAELHSLCDQAELLAQRLTSESRLLIEASREMIDASQNLLKRHRDMRRGLSDAGARASPDAMKLRM
jgi:hypothetical protein